MIQSNVVIAVLALATAFAAGRYSLPERVRVETKTVTVEKKTDKVTSDTDRDRHVETVTTTTRKPDGTLETTTKTVQDSHTDRHQEEAKIERKGTSQENTSETTYAASKLTISALAGASFQRPEIIYGVSLSRPIFGPVSLGAWALTDQTVGFSLGLSF